ncbi:FtsX-like permease family protein [Sinosporangium siamense]|uniref:ABC transporter permease n=1 Tax=Sinosporangium siamense TaxID=1367973 RepID=UPI0035E81EFA
MAEEGPPGWISCARTATSDTGDGTVGDGTVGDGTVGDGTVGDGAGGSGKDRPRGGLGERIGDIVGGGPVRRWVKADLRARWGQALLAVLAVAGVVTALIAAATLLEDGTNPWRGLFAESGGAHVWIHTASAPDAERLAKLKHVSAVAGPYRTAPVSITRDGRRMAAVLRHGTPAPPAVARPLVREGRWLSARVPDGVVVERSFARALGLTPGAPFVVNALNGTRHSLVVTGVAESAEQGFYPEWPGLIWVLPETLEKVEPALGRSEFAVGLRMTGTDPDATRLLTQQVAIALDNEVGRVITWQRVRASMELDNRLLGLLLGLFGAVGLVAAALAIANAAGGRVLTQSMELATLKSLGFTRGQVALTLMAEHGALGLFGVVLGTVSGHLVTVFALETTPVPSMNAAVAGGAALVVLIAVGVPAWRGCRTPPIPAAPAAPPRGRLSHLARLALLFRLPPALVLGVRDAFTRPAHAALTALGLAVPTMLIVIGLGCWATLDAFLADPARVGQAAALQVRQGQLSPDETESLVRSDPQVAAVYPGTEVEALVLGQARTVVTRALGTSRAPYPFPVVEGRAFAARGEAVAGQGMLDLLGAKVGDMTRVTVGGTPLIVRIVGRVVEPDHDGEVLSVGLDSLAVKDAEPPEFYSLVLKPGADPAVVRGRLMAAGDGRLEVLHVVNPAERLAVIRLIIVASIVVLALVGLANLLTVSALGLRDHAVDLAVLKAMGLTPRQVMATLVTGTGLMVVVGVLAGTLLGAFSAAWLIDLQGHTSGVGAGIGRTPSPLTLAATVAIAVGAALLVALLPARRAARARVPVTAR